MHENARDVAALPRDHIAWKINARDRRRIAVCYFAVYPLLLWPLCSLLLLNVLISFDWLDFAVLLFFPGPTVSLVWLVAAAVYWRRIVSFHRALFLRSAEEELEHDLRPPIVLLRNFSDDKNHNIAEHRLRCLDYAPPWFSSIVNLGEPSQSDSDEAILRRLLKGLGPLVAVGDPSSEAIPIHGASRLFCAHNEWQSRVEDLLKRAQLVIYLPHFTPGVVWEWNAILRIVPAERLVIVFSSHEMKENKWNTLKKDAEAFAHVTFPNDPSGCCLTFDPAGNGRWEPEYPFWKRFLSSEPRNRMLASLERALRSIGRYDIPFATRVARLTAKAFLIATVATFFIYVLS